MIPVYTAGDEIPLGPSLEHMYYIANPMRFCLTEWRRAPIVLLSTRGDRMVPRCVIIKCPRHQMRTPDLGIVNIIQCSAGDWLTDSSNLEVRML